MTVLDVAAVLIIILLALGWRLSWLATRVDRAHARAERTWAALDAALVRRAQRATELVQTPGVDPASALLVSDAAAAALEPDLDHHQREQAESDLSHVLEVVAPSLTAGTRRPRRRAGSGQPQPPAAQRRGGHGTGAASAPGRPHLPAGRTRGGAATIRDGRWSATTVAR